jgi:hypothetical protein
MIENQRDCLMLKKCFIENDSIVLFANYLWQFFTNCGFMTEQKNNISSRKTTVQETRKCTDILLPTFIREVVVLSRVTWMQGHEGTSIKLT